jgi:hypothetical protein
MHFGEISVLMRKKSCRNVPVRFFSGQHGSFNRMQGTYRYFLPKILTQYKTIIVKTKRFLRMHVNVSYVIHNLKHFENRGSEESKKD